MLGPETPQAAAGAAGDVARDVGGETPDTAESAQAPAADAARAGGAPDAGGDEPADTSWDVERADALDTDRSIELDPGRVHGDDLQSDAERSEGEPDE